jgi:isopentenyldiphosphate isomerase
LQLVGKIQLPVLRSYLSEGGSYGRNFYILFLSKKIYFGYENKHGVFMEEFLDIVDELDNVIGSMSRTEVYKKELSNFRVINAFLKNGKGQLWIPKRTATKRLYPLHLDVSVGGHVSSGESYEFSFERELKEELNINLCDVDYKEVGYFNPTNQKVSAFMKVYEIQAEFAPNFNKEDFIEGSWLFPVDIVDTLKKGVKGKPDLFKLLNLLYLD